MPETFTPTPGALSSSYTLPNNTEPANAETLKTNVLKPLANGLAGVAALVTGTPLAGRPRLTVTTTTITVGPLAVRTAGGLVETTTNTVIDSTNLEGGGSFSGNTWYYVYVSVVNGAFSFEISTTGPTLNLRNKTGDASKLYLGTVRTSFAAGLLGSRTVGNRTVYDTDVLVLNGGTQTTWASVDCSGCVPPTAVMALINVTLLNNTAQSRICSVRVNGALAPAISLTATSKYLVDLGGTTSSSINTTFTEIALDAGRAFEYQTGNSSSFVTINVVGYIE